MAAISARERSCIEGCVHAIVMEKLNKTVCFEYYENGRNETQYIVADFAISDCQWVEARDNIDGGNSSSDDNVDDNTANKKLCCGAVKNKHKEKSARTVRGWYYLDENEDCAVASLDETIHFPVDAPRKLRNSKRM